LDTDVQTDIISRTLVARLKELLGRERPGELLGELVRSE
jgi:hypothetical protein